MARAFRLLVDPPAPGFWNMAVDEALLASAATGGAPTLRFYAWDGPWLSLGRAQRLAPVRRAACAAAGVGVVRRVSGGGAVLHGADLTYALAAPADLLPRGLLASYERIAEGLAGGLRALGIQVEGRGPPGAAPAAGFDCFAAPVGHELCAAGRKLVGSAQRRVRGALLQHGSLRLRPDPAPLARAAGLDPGRTASLAELGFEGTLEALLAALCRSLGEALEATLGLQALAPGELRDARRRAVRKGRCGGKSPSAARLQSSSAPPGRR